MRNQLRVVSLAVVALLALVALAACGEDDDEAMVDDVTRIAVAGAPTEMPTPDPNATPVAGGGQTGGGNQGGSGDGGGEAPGTFRLESYDLGWKTADQPGPQVNLTVSPGTTIELVNTGAIGHNFEVADLGVSVDIPVGETVTATIPADAQPGEYKFICNVVGHAAVMFGTLIVQ